MSNTIPLQSLPKALAKLEQDVSSHRLYRPGQPLTAEGVLPNQVLVILEGRARMLTRERNQTATLLKLGPGDVVGLASLISAAPCERAHASTDVRAAVLGDQDLLNQINSDPEFSHWCHQHLWAAELERLLQPMREANAEDLPALAPKLDELMAEACIIEPQAGAVEAAFNRDCRVFVASANSDLELGSELLSTDALTGPVRPPMPLRLIGIPAEQIRQLLTPLLTAELVDPNESGSIPAAEEGQSALAVIEPAQAGTPISHHGWLRPTGSEGQSSIGSCHRRSGRNPRLLPDAGATDAAETASRPDGEDRERRHGSWPRRESAIDRPTGHHARPARCGGARDTGSGKAIANPIDCAHCQSNSAGHRQQRSRDSVGIPQRWMARTQLR